MAEIINEIPEELEMEGEEVEVKADALPQLLLLPFLTLQEFH